MRQYTHDLRHITVVADSQVKNLPHKTEIKEEAKEKEPHASI